MENILKNKVNGLMNAITNSEFNDMVEDVKDTLQLCSDYVALVANEEASIQMARMRLEPADYRSFVKNIDSNRRARHEALMANINMLNRLAAALKVEPVFDVDIDDRESYFRVAKQVVDEYFTDGQAGSATVSIK